MVANVDDYSDEGVTQLLKSSIPIVTLDKKTEKKPAVISDNFKGVECLVRYVHKMGHTKIAYIYGDLSGVTSTRVEAFRRTMEALNIDIREDYLLGGCYRDPQKTEVLTEKLMKMSDPPTCILLPDDFSAIGALNAFERLGLSVPNDVSVAGYDGITLSQVLSPKLTTFKQDTDGLGKAAAEQLISLINKELPENSEPVVIEGSLLEGGSVRDLTK